MNTENYDLGIVMEISRGEVDVMLVPGSEHVKIHLEPELAGSLRKMQIVALNLDHTAFVMGDELNEDDE